MKNFTALCIFGLLAVATCETYSDKYDNTDVEAVIINERLLGGYFSCLMDKGSCTPEGLDLKKNLPDAMATDCSKCTEAQKRSAKVMMRHLINKKPDMWNELSGKYDPNSIYRSKHEKELKELQE